MVTQTRDKRCPRCKIIKPLEAFYHSKSNKDGLDGYCKHCRHEVTAEYARSMTPEQLERRKKQKLAYFNRQKAKIVYPIIGKRFEESLAGNLPSSKNPG